MDGYLDIVIDPKNTDVSIRYDIFLDVDYLHNINEAFIITNIEELNGNKLTLTNKNTYTGIIKDYTKNTIRIYIKWEDIENNNENDYNIGTTNQEVEIPININITQYLNEEILEYSEE